VSDDHRQFFRLLLQPPLVCAAPPGDAAMADRADENETPFIFRTLPIPVVGPDRASLGY
jgi:hypothetical protein